MQTFYSQTLRSTNGWNRSRIPRKRVVVHAAPKPIVRYLYYAFIFSVPFEAVDVGVGTLGTVPKLIGVLFAAGTILQPGLCWKRPPKTFWLFASYLFLFFVWGSWSIVSESELTRNIIVRFITLAQLLVLFWLSLNILQHERAVKGSLFTLIVSCTIVGALIVTGVTAGDSARASVGDANPNLMGTTVGLGVIALIGVKYAYLRARPKFQLLVWFCFTIMAIGVVRTGSRGALLVVVMSLLVFPLTHGSLASKIKIGSATLIGAVVLVASSYQIETMRLRWEKTFSEADLAGRQQIYSHAWNMFIEQPFGWGPMRNRAELGDRLGLVERDTHNLYLYLLTEVGVVGSIPFFLGLWFCLAAAWRARKTAQGALPLALLVLFLTVNLKGTYLNKKFFWFVLAYSLASATVVVRPASPYVDMRPRFRNLIERDSKARAL